MAMVVYRIVRSKFARDLSGEGARLYGGRWNHVLTPCVYTSENRALAVLEYSVNIGLEDIPRALNLVTIEFPDFLTRQIELASLPGNWKDFPAPTSTKDFGTAYLKKLSAAVLKIPSAIIPSEYNYLINPLHPDINKINISKVEDWAYELRIKG